MNLLILYDEDINATYLGQSIYSSSCVLICKQEKRSEKILIIRLWEVAIVEGEATRRKSNSENESSVEYAGDGCRDD